MYVMYDAVDIENIPADAAVVAGYVGGDYPTFEQLAHQFPHARRISIAVNASEEADELDVENGDATPADAPGWIRRQPLIRPSIYASLDTMPAVTAALHDAGVDRSECLLRVADWTGTPHIPPGFNACQWTNRAEGRALDETLGSNAYVQLLTGANHPAFGHAYIPTDEARWEHEYDQVAHRPGPWPALRRRVLHRYMSARAIEISKLALHEPNGWDKLNRRRRYELLLERL
jgi:hypothetical protein